jgi:glycosyltransferase involved in cell wall biosynthesis
MPATGPQVSVVIPTFDRAELLPETIRALAAQDTAGFTYEVVFVDDGSTDETPAILDQAVAEHPAVFRRMRGRHAGGPAGPRNMGIRAARGETILILDDDVIPDHDLVLRHWEFHRNNPAANAAAVGELYLPSEVRADPMSLFHSFPYGEMKAGATLSFYYFWTCNISLKRAFMLEHGMFNEDATLYPLEDMECGYRLVQSGLRLEFLPCARGRHVHKMKAEWVPKKGQRLGRAQFAVTQVVPDRRLKERLAIVNPESGLPSLAWRQIKRGLLRVVENPITFWILRMLGGEGSRRTAVTDLYHYLIFRRNVLHGYRDARAEHRGSRGGRSHRPSELVSFK